jgi:hypothetical protein
MTDRIQNLVDLGKLARELAPDDEVAGLWSNALQAFGDACIRGMSPSGRLVRAYDAGRLAATALVRARDLRVRASNHHEVTIAVARFVGGDDLRRALGEMDGIRSLRTDAEYGWQAGATEADAERAVGVVRGVLLHAVQDLRGYRPTLSNRIQPPTGTDSG